MALQINAKAPDLTLTCHKGDAHKLSDEWSKGPVVLAFFPLAFTGVCTEEMCEIRDGLADFGNLNAQVFGVSVDSRFALNAFAEKNSISFHLLSDFNKEACTAFDVKYEDFIGLKGVAKRSAFVIDKTGTIVYASSSDDAKVKPDFAAIKEAIGKLA